MIYHFRKTFFLSLCEINRLRVQIKKKKRFFSHAKHLLFSKQSIRVSYDVFNESNEKLLHFINIKIGYANFKLFYEDIRWIDLSEIKSLHKNEHLRFT